MSSENHLIRHSPNNGGSQNPPENNIQNKGLPEEVLEDLRSEPFPFKAQDLHTTLLRVGSLPSDKNPDGSPKPDKNWARELPQWILGGNLEVGANLAIAMLASEVEGFMESPWDQQAPQTESLLERIAICQSRLDWERSEKSNEAQAADDPIPTQSAFIS